MTRRDEQGLCHKGTKNWTVLLLLMLGLWLVSVNVGPAGVLWQATPGTLGWYQLLQLRGWRGVLALIEGAGLATSGLVMQTLFRNPLVDASLLGVSQASALGVLFMIALGASVGLQQLGAVVFAATVLILLLLIWQRRTLGMEQILLLGLAVNALLGALMQLGLAWLPSPALLGAWTFLQGSLAGADGLSVLRASVAMLLIVFALHRYGRDMDWLLLGDDAAASAGVPVVRLQKIMLVICAVTVALLVAQAGVLGFVGMLAPAMVRWRMTGGHRAWWPWVLGLGALLVLTADILARLLVSPAELPVGVVTSLIGAPAFAMILGRGLWRR